MVLVVNGCPVTTRIEAETLEAKRLAHEEALANGGGIECGCCFGEEVWVSRRCLKYPSAVLAQKAAYTPYRRRCFSVPKVICSAESVLHVTRKPSWAINQLFVTSTAHFVPLTPFRRSSAWTPPAVSLSSLNPNSLVFSLSNLSPSITV